MNRIHVRTFLAFYTLLTLIGLLALVSSVGCRVTDLKLDVKELKVLNGRKTTLTP